MPYKNQEVKARYMKIYHDHVDSNIVIFIVYEDFSHDEEFKKQLNLIQMKHSVEFYFLWHGTHMQSVMYRRNSRFSEAKALQILNEACLKPANGKVILSRKSLSCEIRYLPHLDDKDKTQYSINDFVIIGNSDPLTKIKFLAEEIELYTYIIKRYIVDSGISSPLDLQKFISGNRIFKFVYRKQAYKSDIDSLIEENARKEDRVVQQQQHDELMTAIASMTGKATVTLSQTSTPPKKASGDKIPPEVWKRFKCNS